MEEALDLSFDRLLMTMSVPSHAVFLCWCPSDQVHGAVQHSITCWFLRQGNRRYPNNFPPYSQCYIEHTMITSGVSRCKHNAVGTISNQYE